MGRLPARHPLLVIPQAATKTIILYIINKYQLSLMYNKQALGPIAILCRRWMVALP
ncbi:hypothetical protein MESS4_720016 [Mesorhizobium sp. STM 4661]|nr:hypothetical protein MESS4_720016 [Mesorhizobium sp. STM 4661]